MLLLPSREIYRTEPTGFVIGLLTAYRRRTGPGGDAAR
jgi:hypothetical protein